MNRLKGKVAIITGAGQGLGLAAAKLFAQEGAARALTRHAAFQLAAKGIRVNSVMPGPIKTPMLRESLEADPAIASRVEQNNPLPPHISTAEHIAQGVLFLASDESATMCGAEVVIDCGHTII